MKRSIGIVVLMQAIFAAVAVAGAQAPGVTITYAPAAAVTPIPSSFLLVGAGIMFMFLAFRKVQSLPTGRPFVAILVLAGSAFFEVSTRQQWIAKAEAMYCGNCCGGNCVPIYQLFVQGGSTLNFNLNYGAEAQIQNTSGVSEQITGLSSLPSNLFVTSTDTPQCTVGTVLAPGASCYVKILEIIDPA